MISAVAEAVDIVVEAVLVADIVEVVVVAVEAVTNHIATQVAPDQITNKLPVLDFRRNMKLKQVVFFLPK
jgi:hypothetical protein